MKLPLWCEILLHTDTGSAPKVSWFELFFDLQYVPILYKLGTYLKLNPDAYGVSVTFALFLCFWIVRMHSNMIFGRFSNDDIFGKVVFYIIQASVLLMAVHLDPDHSIESISDMENFASAFLVAKVALLVYYLKAAYYVPKARNHVWMTVGGLLIGISTAAGAIVTTQQKNGDEEALLILLTVGNISEILFNMVAEVVPRFYVPMCVDHFAERTGLLVILALGEAILGIILAPYGQTDNARHSVVLVFGFTLVFCLSLTYFDSQPLSEVKHAVHRSSLRGCLYMYVHLALTFTIFTTGVGVTLVLKYSGQKQEVSLYGGRMVASFSGASCFLFNICRFLHKSCNQPNTLSWWRNGFRYALSIFMSFFGEFTVDPLALVGVLLAVVVVLNSIDTVVYSYTHKESQLSIGRTQPHHHAQPKHKNDPSTLFKACQQLLTQLGNEGTLRTRFHTWLMWTKGRATDRDMHSPLEVRRQFAKYHVAPQHPIAHPVHGTNDPYGLALESPRGAHSHPRGDGSMRVMFSNSVDAKPSHTAPIKPNTEANTNPRVGSLDGTPNSGSPNNGGSPNGTNLSEHDRKSFPASNLPEEEEEKRLQGRQDSTNVVNIPI